MLLFLSADAEKLGLSNEIVANGGLNGSYATIYCRWM